MATVESSQMAEDQANNNHADSNNESFSNDDTSVVDQKQQQQQSTPSDAQLGELATTNDDNNEESNSGQNDSKDDDKEDKTNLIVNYLPQNMTDAEFEDLFNKFGSMKSCKIVRNRVSGYSYGFGFVDFETHEQALKAIDELNGHELDTKKIKVAFARPAGQDIKQANLYIKNVPNQWTQDDVRKVFEPYGNIIQVRVLGNDRGVAFVLFDLRKQAEEALQALNGTQVEGCDKPFEIKFAADKKTEKNSSNKSSNNNNNRGRSKNQNQGSQNRNNSRGRQNFNQSGQQNQQRGNSRQGRQRGASFFDRQPQNDRQGGRGGGQNQFNSMGNNQYQGNFHQMNNGIGPIRQAPSNRMNRYAPFVPVQQTQMTQAQPGAASMAPHQMAPNPAYGYPTQQQQMIPFSMMPAQSQMAPMQPMAQTGQPVGPVNPMGIYGATQMPVGYGALPQNAMSNMYSVASNNLTNAANMQPPLGQSMSSRNNSNSGLNSKGGSGGGDGCTLFVYNIGPDSDEDELKEMFSPYGQVVKCNVVRKGPGQETKGFGFVTLRDRDQANAAIAGLDGFVKRGRALQVSLKK